MAFRSITWAEARIREFDPDIRRDFDSEYVFWLATIPYPGYRFLRSMGKALSPGNLREAVYRDPKPAPDWKDYQDVCGRKFWYDLIDVMGPLAAYHVSPVFIQASA